MKARSLLVASLPLVWAQDLCDQFAYHESNGYYLNNNEWGSGSGEGDQCTYVDSIADNGVSWHTEWSWSGGENNVKSYPYSGVTLSEKKLVSDIGSLNTKAEWAYNGDSVRANVAYDLFTAADPNHETSSGDYELMIWYAARRRLSTRVVDIHSERRLTRCDAGLPTWAVSTPSATRSATSTWRAPTGSCSWA